MSRLLGAYLYGAELGLIIVAPFVVVVLLGMALAHVVDVIATWLEGRH